jgi:hypothetical protein
MEKKSLKTWDNSEIFKKMPNEINRPIDENSPNLVTLFLDHESLVFANVSPAGTPTQKSIATNSCQ